VVVVETLVDSKLLPKAKLKSNLDQKQLSFLMVEGNNFIQIFTTGFQK